MFGLEHFILKLLKTERGKTIVAILTTVSGAGFVWLLVPASIQGWRLAENHVEAVGQVIDSRVSHGPHGGTNYEIRYRFKPVGSGNWYFQEDHTGRTELWEVLPRAEWEKAVLDRKIAVVYEPSNPRNNGLARDVSGLRTYAITSIVLSGIWFLAGATWLAIRIVRMTTR